MTTRRPSTSAREDGTSYAQVYEWVQAQLLPDYAALALYCYLTMRVYGEQGWSFSQEHLAEALGMSVSTVYRKTQVLVDAKVIRIERTVLDNGEKGWNKYYIVHNIPPGVKRLVHATNGHQRPVPPVTHDRTHRSPMTDIHRQEERRRKFPDRGSTNSKSFPLREGDFDAEAWRL